MQSPATPLAGLWLRRARVRVPSVTLLCKIELMRRLVPSESPAAISKGKEIEPGAIENRFLSLLRFLALPQARFPGADDRLRPVSNLQLGEDVGDVVANGLGAQR